MSDQNLPFTRFPTREGRTPVPRVERVHWDGDHHEPDPPHTPAEGRIVRVRSVPAADGATEAARWTADGALPCDGPAGWTVLERTRRDAVTGLPRRQRLAVGPGDPASVLNLSVLEPPHRDDDELWHRTLERMAAGRPAREPDPPDGDGHDWAA
ncbi:MAG: hypothetical protein IT200_00125 [Thermoleophilia bacterium]|nr:hypothetical protein [Thermoleophilia bacterium]